MSRPTRRRVSASWWPCSGRTGPTAAPWPSWTGLTLAGLPATVPLVIVSVVVSIVVSAPLFALAGRAIRRTASRCCPPPPRWPWSPVG
ncbi:hypothetical protein V1634_21650 [Plantactinospora veratri]|uniref:ABC transmembrane type-1 domain-containing protein n=1 Tax=Plantactinospora veratri TaxID=1436122 RepID=A0ABU7SHM7_9ACTN